MSQPVYIQQPTMQVPQPWPPRSTQPTAQQPQFKPMATAQQPMPAPTARGHREELPDALMKPPTAAVKLAPLSMPSPEELGVTPTAPAAALVKVDWNETRDRLQRMGCVGFQTAKIGDGRHRVVVTLRTNRVDQEQNIEAVAATEGEAVVAVLARAEQWVATGR